MPRRNDLKSILIIGSGPIIIGQACEFDYSGVQACKALKEEGYRIILVNSNPATIMTDPEFAHRTYIEPISPEVVTKIIEKERPCALLPTLGGQTALNVAVKLYEDGVLERYNVEMIGAKYDSILKAENRQLFKKAMDKIGLLSPPSDFANNLERATEIMEVIGLPVVVRPSFTLGGKGGGIVYNLSEFRKQVTQGIAASPINEVLIEKSLVGWKEFEFEVMRDLKDNVVIICSIENVDPMGVHTGDSITVAPAQTLSDKEFQVLRNASVDIIREIGVDTGGSNVQFAINPEDGEVMIIEMNPRVSRSSALASKATGFPIAKIAAKLAVGYSLDELTNDITRETPASFEPTIDYVVTKIPRWTFEKFPDADNTLTTQMKSVGEAMSIGRTFKESLQKGLRSLEIGRYGFGFDGRGPDPEEVTEEVIISKLRTPNAERIFYLSMAIQRGFSLEQIHIYTGMDPWFLDNMHQIVAKGQSISGRKLTDLSKDELYEVKQFGFSDIQIAHICACLPEDVRLQRLALGVTPVYKMVDTCAAEFEAYTPYMYSTYDCEDEAPPTDRKKIIVLGGGPNRIGQGIEFDYCCVHGVMALAESGFETIMINSNPETVSTDYDTSDRLYFEPLTFEDVMSVIDREKPTGVVVQYGGQTPLKLALSLEKAGVPIIGTTPDSIDLAEDRERFGALLDKHNIRQTENGIACDFDEAKKIATKIGYPVLVRPSYVLGGRAMEIVYTDLALKSYLANAVLVSPERPILIDKYLEQAIEVDVDAVCDGKATVIAGVMEHIEEAGVHSGDSACVLPPHSLAEHIVDRIEEITVTLATEIQVKGLMNIQFAVKDDDVYVLEVNPRASRTVPFVSKATGVPWAKVAVRVMAGELLENIPEARKCYHTPYYSVKEAVLPFSRFEGVDTLLGPEMKSTGEVMALDTAFAPAFAKTQHAAGMILPSEGTIFISVADKDKQQVLPLARKIASDGYKILATRGTSNFLAEQGVENTKVKKVAEGRTHIVDMIINGEVQMIINTASGHQAVKDSVSIRCNAIAHNVPCITTIPGAKAAVEALAYHSSDLGVLSLQEYHEKLPALSAKTKS